MNAQSKISVKGSVIDKETSEALMGANVQVLSLPDSAFVAGEMANNVGAFTLRDLKKGQQYVLKITFMGYVTRTLPLNLKNRKGHQVDLGYLTMLSDQRLLQETVVTRTAARMNVSGDSLQFNASSYRVPQGSTLESLVKLLPGAEVDDNGAVTINGKSVTKILVDGKEFFLNDISVAMRNIPVEIIEKVRAYERKSDMARITGVDDGEDETVLDLSVKKGMNSGWFGNVLGGVGNHHRYTLKELINYFNDNTTVTAIGNVRNVSEQRGWARPGQFSLKEGGLNFASQNETMETGGSVSYRYEGSDIRNNTNYKNTTAGLAPYGKAEDQKRGSNHGMDAQFKMEWRPDTMTTVLFRPTFTYTNTRYIYGNDQGEFNEDVSNEDMSNIQNLSSIVNYYLIDWKNRTTKTYASGDLQVTRRIGNKGRNITLRVYGDFTHSNEQKISATDNMSDNSRIINNRYTDTPGRNYTIASQFVWSEPLGKGYFLNFNYRYSYLYAKNDRQAFVYDESAYSDLRQYMYMCRFDVDQVLGRMREVGYELRDTVALSQFSERQSYKHRIGLQLRRINKMFNFAVGVTAFPNYHKLSYRYMGKEFPDVTQHILNIIPRVNMKFNFTKTTNLQIKYDGRPGEPDLTDMLEIVDDSELPNLKKGNPKLKPEFSNNWEVSFNTFNPETQQGIWSWFYGKAVNNAIGTFEGRDSALIKTTMPINVDGNWNMGTGVGYNRGLGKEKHFAVGGSLGVTYNQYAGYYSYMDSIDNSWFTVEGKTTTKNTCVSGHLNSSYRNDYISIELRGWLDQYYTRNNVNPDVNLDAKNYRYGGEVTWNAPWGTEVSTNLYMTSRRGYAQAAMNTDELLWNASVSHSFLKGRALTIKGEVFDILGQRTCVNRTASASTISETFSNGVYQYGLLTVIYRFSVFAGHNAMGTKDERKSDAYARRNRPSW